MPHKLELFGPDEAEMRKAGTLASYFLLAMSKSPQRLFEDIVGPCQSKAIELAFAERDLPDGTRDLKLDLLEVDMDFQLEGEDKVQVAVEVRYDGHMIMPLSIVGAVVVTAETIEALGGGQKIH